MAIEEFGGLRFNQVWDNQTAADLPSGKEPLLLCRNGQQPALSLEGAPLRIDGQYGIDLGEAPFLRIANNQASLQAPGGLSIQTGSSPTMALTVAAGGDVTIGTTTRPAKLEVQGNLKTLGLEVSGDLQIGPTRLNSAQDNRLEVHGAGDLHFFTGAGPDTERLTVLANGKVGIGTSAPEAQLHVAGNLAVNGSIQVPKTSDGQALLYNVQFDNENEFVQGNLKLSMGSWGLVFPSQINYQFIIGHERHSPPINIPGFPPQPARSTFNKVFSVDQDGHAFFAAGKQGWVYDLFVNVAGELLEQGDVVVLNPSGPVGHYGSGDSIPIPEVDLSRQAYDRRVCGIVASFVSAHDLPTIFPKSEAEAQTSEGHPLAQYAGPSEGQSRTEVKDRQMGRMVTLGAYAFCKVDADLGPIEAGDLLTTSPTRGHAQKVLEPAKAVGAILGKAMAPLKCGKGKIPVLVALQ